LSEAKKDKKNTELNFLYKLRTFEAFEVIEDSALSKTLSAQHKNLYLFECRRK